MEGWRGATLCGYLCQAALCCVRLGLNATACLPILARNGHQLSGDGGGNSAVPHLPQLNLIGANLFAKPPAKPVCGDPHHAAPLRLLPMWMMESALTVLHCNIQRE